MKPGFGCGSWMILYLPAALGEVDAIYHSTSWPLKFCTPAKPNSSYISHGVPVAFTIGPLPMHVPLPGTVPILYPCLTPIARDRICFLQEVILDYRG